MKLAGIKNVLQLQTIIDGDDNLEIKTGCGSDLMSDVLAFCQSKTLLLTGLTNAQAVRTAEMVGIKVIIFVRGKQPQPAAISLAKEKQIAIYVTTKSLFECCGILYENGIKPEVMRKIEIEESN